HHRPALLLRPIEPFELSLRQALLELHLVASHDPSPCWLAWSSPIRRAKHWLRIVSNQLELSLHNRTLISVCVHGSLETFNQSSWHRLVARSGQRPLLRRCGRLQGENEGYVMYLIMPGISAQRRRLPHVPVSNRGPRVLPGQAYLPRKRVRSGR